MSSVYWQNVGNESIEIMKCYHCVSSKWIIKFFMYYTIFFCLVHAQFVHVACAFILCIAKVKLKENGG